MPNRTQLIFSDNPGAVPATYTVPPSMDLVLQSVVVKWDGSGASGAFLPVLAVRSQDGQLVGRFHPGSQVEAGDTATVTYAPFLRAPAATLPDEFTHFFANATLSGAGVTSGVVKELTAATGGHDGNDIAFQQDGTGHTLWNRGWSFAFRIYYSATLTVQWPSFAGDRYIELTVPNVITDPNVAMFPVRVRGSATPDDDTQTVTAHWFGSGTAGFVKIIPNAFQASGVGRTIGNAGLTVIAHMGQPFT